MKKLLLVPIILLSINAFCQKINFEKIALKFVIDSSESLLKQPLPESKILISSCSQSADIFQVLSFWELACHFSKSDSTLISKSQIQYNEELSNLTDEFEKKYHYDSTSSKHHSRLYKYNNKNAKCNFLFVHCRNVRMKLDDTQKQRFSNNGYRYAKENAGFISASSPYFINYNEFAIVLVDFYVKDQSNMRIYVFIDMDGKILRYYCFDDKLINKKN